MHVLQKASTCKITVVRNDAIAIAAIAKYDKIVLSPGPGLPKDAGIMPQLLQHYASTKPILGVCLGMQAIGEFYGASLSNLSQVHHGVASLTTVVANDILFKNIPSTFNTGRYHSWVINPATIPDTLTVTAISPQSDIMAIRHKQLDVCGVQFHPESILTEHGEQLLKNWVEY